MDTRVERSLSLSMVLPGIASKNCMRRRLVWEYEKTLSRGKPFRTFCKLFQEKLGTYTVFVP